MSREKVPLHGYLSCHDNAYLKSERKNLWTSITCHLQFQMKIGLTTHCTIFMVRNSISWSCQKSNVFQFWKVVDKSIFERQSSMTLWKKLFKIRTPGGQKQVCNTAELIHQKAFYGDLTMIFTCLKFYIRSLRG